MESLEKTLEEIIAERKKEAKDKGIFEEAKTIVTTLGEISKEGGYNSNITELKGIYEIPVADVRITYHYKSSRSLRDKNTQIKIVSGTTEVFNGTEIYQFRSGKTDLYINGYIPGEWEKALEKPYIDSQIRNEAKELERKLSEIETTVDPRIAFGFFKKL